MGAAYQATAILTDDESFGFAMTIEQANGTELDLSEYTFEYEMDGCGGTLRLASGNGITLDLDNGLVIVDPGSERRFRAGQYRHGFRARHTLSGKMVQLFDGTVTVTEGNFR